MRDVETYERARNLLKSELTLQFVNRIARALFGLFTGESLLLQEMTSILHGEVHELALRSPLWSVDLGTLERRLEELSLLEVERNEQLARAILERQIGLREERL